MPANRRRRRSAAARMRRGSPRPPDQLGFGSRLGLGLAGAVLIIIALLLMLHPQRSHALRGAGLAFVFGCVLLGSTLVWRRR